MAITRNIQVVLAAAILFLATTAALPIAPQEGSGTNVSSVNFTTVQRNLQLSLAVLFRAIRLPSDVSSINFRFANTFHYKFV